MDKCKGKSTQQMPIYTSNCALSRQHEFLVKKFNPMWQKSKVRPQFIVRSITANYSLSNILKRELLNPEGFYKRKSLNQAIISTINKQTIRQLQFSEHRLQPL